MDDVLTDTERSELGRLVTEQLAGTRERIRSLEIDLRSIVDSADTSNIDDEHDPEGATIAYERALVISLLDSAKASLQELERARAELAEGTYGRCTECGDPIATARLLARPTAATCVGCA